MSLEKIISIPGMNGLYKMVAQMRNGGYIVESLTDQKKVPVSSMQRIIMLQDISVYTLEADMPLDQVLWKMKGKDELCASINSQSDPAMLRSTLKQIIPEFDEERVHNSDIKKMFSWYTMLKDQLVEPVKEVVKDSDVVNDSKKEIITEEPTITEEKVKKPKAKKTAGKEV